MELVIQKLLTQSPLPGLGLVFLAGILSGLGTCMIVRMPVIFGFVGGSAGSRQKALILTILFAGGFIVSYSLLGAVLGLIGSTAFQLIRINKYIYLATGIFLFICGLLIAGLVPLKISFFHNHFPREKFKNFSYPGALLFGLVFAFLEMPACPCCGPILLFLAGIAVTKKLTLAILIFLTFAVGQSLPLILVGTSTTLLKFWSPKITQYENWFRLVAGNILIIMAIYFLITA